MGRTEEHSQMIHKMTVTRNNEPEKVPQYIIAFSACLGSAVIGSILAWTSPIGILIKNTSHGSLSVTSDQFNTVGSLVPIGALMGALPAGMMANAIGRQKTMVLCSLIWIVTWIMTTTSTTDKLYMLFAARFVAGVMVGVVSTVVPMYVAEIADSSVRGSLGSLFQLLMTVGILFTYGFGASESYYVICVSCSALSIAFLIAAICIPESPVYLLSKGRYKDAEKSLQKLRGSYYNITDEMSTLKLELEESANRTFSISRLFSRANVMSLVICLGLMVFQQLSGINAVIFYAATIFEAAGSQMSPSVCTIVLGSVQVVVTMVSGVLIEKAGRKILLLCSDFAMAVCLGMLGYYFYQQEHHVDISNIGWLPLLSLVIFIVMFSVGFGPIPWLMTGELLSPDIKGFATGMAVSLNWTLTALVTGFFQPLLNSLGIGYTYWMFGVISAVGTLFVATLVPETKGKTLQQIQRQLGGY